MSGERVLITGVNGFIGSHMAQYLLERQFTVYGMGRSRHSRIQHPQFFYTPCDLSDPKQIFSWMAQNDIQYVIHLAAKTNRPQQENHPLPVINVNCMGTMRLLEAIRLKPQMQVKGILLAGSSHECITAYGNRKDGETTPPPGSLYGWSKRLAAEVGQMYAHLYGLPVVIARTYNVIGPGATAGVASSLARQVVEIEQGMRPPKLVVGNLKMERDFLDVRDVAAAYWALLTKAPYRPGEVYPVASGTSRRIEEMVEVFRRHARCPFDVVVDPSLFRPNEPPQVLGNFEKLHRATGWKPQWSFEQSLVDVLAHARQNFYPSMSTAAGKRGEEGK